MQFNWRREYGELPSTSMFDRQSRLILHQIRKEDTGRYICQMTTEDQVVSQNYVDVKLKREYRTRRQDRENPMRWRTNY